MADEAHLEILKQGVGAWNRWRGDNPKIVPDLADVNLSGTNLSGADLSDADLGGAKLSGANLFTANLNRADLFEADLTEADLGSAELIGTNLIGADLSWANLSWACISAANLTEAYLIGADLSYADLSETNFSKANLSWADLSQAVLTATILVDTNFTSAILTDCWVYGISAWNINLDAAKQSDLVITRQGEPRITVDNLEVAQFIYLLLNNQKLRDVISTITSKAVLILGRFTPERKAVLDAIREELRKHNYLPILFDFETSASRDITETVSTLAHIARFVIADITDARSIPQELHAIVPHLPSVPVQPLLLASQNEYGMFEHFKRYPWVLKTHLYESQDVLLTSIYENVIAPAEAKVNELVKSETQLDVMPDCET